MHNTSFTFSLFDPQLNNPFAFLTSDDLAHYFVNHRTSRRTLHHWDIGGQPVPEGRARLVPRNRGMFGQRYREPTAVPPLQDIDINPTQPAMEPGSPKKKSRTSTQLLALTDAPTIVFVPRDIVTQALGRMGAHANVRGADQGAEARQQLLAIQDIQQQQAQRDQNVQRVAATAQADLAQASGSSSSNPHAGRFAAALGGGAASSSSGAASSSTGIAPQPPPAASSGSPRRTRLTKKTPASKTVQSHRGPGTT